MLNRLIALYCIERAALSPSFAATNFSFSCLSAVYAFATLIPEMELSTAAFISEVFSLEAEKARIRFIRNLEATKTIIGIIASRMSESHGLMKHIIMSAPIIERTDKNTSSGPW